MIPIRPTMRGVVLMMTAAGCTGAAMVNVNITTSLIASCMLAIAAGSFVLAFCSVHRIDLRRAPNRDGACGTPLQLPFVIVNRTWLWRQTVIVRERIDFTEKYPFFCEAVAGLAPYETRLVKRVMPVLRRGFYQLARLELIGGDPAGFFSYVRSFDLPGEVMIYPECPRLAQLPDVHRRHSIISVTGRPLGISGAGQEFFGVREYSPYDEMRFIHWKVSARQRKLMVKEFEANTVSHVYIVLDATKQNTGNDFFDNNFEFLVKIVAAVTNCLADMHCRLTFITADRGEIVRFSGEAVGIRNAVFDLLAVIAPGDIGFDEIIDREIDHFMFNSVFYCLTMSEPENLNAKLDCIHERGVDVRWILAPRRYFPSADAIRIGRRRTEIAPRDECYRVKPVTVTVNSDIVKVLSHE